MEKKLSCMIIFINSSIINLFSFTLENTLVFINFRVYYYLITRTRRIKMSCMIKMNYSICLKK